MIVNSETIMPYKCIECNKVVQSIEEADCQCLTSNFLKTPIIHYIHEEGKGIPISKSIATEGATIEGEIAKPKRQVINRTLNLCCNSKKHDNMIYSIVTTLVTCPHCLDFIRNMKNDDN